MKIFPPRGKNSRALPVLASPTIWFLMRISLFISCLLALSLQLSALHSKGQTIDQIEVTLEFRNAKLADVLRQIQNRSGVNFVYSPDHVNTWKHISVAKEKRTVKKLLDLVLGETTLTYKEEGGTVVILKKKAISTVDPEETPVPVKTESLIFQLAGTVKDRNGFPLPGVNIVVKGTARGTTTDADGKFMMDVSEDEMLVLSFIGYKTIEISPGKQTVIDIVMEEDVTTLQTVEVFSTDYFSTTKAKSTMNISKVDGEEIRDQPVTTLINALVGRIPGVDITPNSGLPGTASKIQIRGTNSLSFQGSYPLYVVDGIQIDSRPLQGVANGGYDPLAGISPANIETVEVLKDAAATAIYGSRGANGVIRITTKRATKDSERTNFDFNVYRGVGMVSNKVDLLNREQYLEMRHEAYKNAGTEPSVDLLDVDITGVWDSTRSTDWQDVLLGGTANILDVQGGLSGGSEHTSFRISGGYHKEGTVFPGDFGYDRFFGALSVNHVSQNKKLEFSASVNLGYTRNEGYSNGQFVTLALTLPPIAPKLYNNDGTLNWQNYGFFDGTYTANTWDNPMAALLYENNIKSNTILSKALVGYEFVPGLKVKSLLSISNISNDETRKSPLAAQAPVVQPYFSGSMRFNNNGRRAFMIEPQLEFIRTFGHHNVNSLIGLTWQQSRSIYRSVEGRDYPSDALLGSIQGARTVNTTTDIDNQYKYASMYMHVGYDFKDKYLLDVTARRDGSSKFGPGRRFGNFGAIGVGWVFSKEPFLKDVLPLLSYGKIRSSYGITGNDQIEDYAYLDTYSIVNPGYQDQVSLSPKALYNPDYAWETTKKFEVAIETAIADNRIHLDASWYRNLSSNQLINYSLSATTGFPSVLANFDAIIENTGWEFAITTVNISSEKFRWTSSFNLTIPRNKLLKFDGIEQSPYASTYKVGEPLSIRRLYTFKGINAETGLYEVEDLNSDGLFNSQDRKFMEPLGRSSYYGLSNDVNYGNLSLSFLLQFSRNPQSDFFYQNQPGSAFNQPVEVLNRWQKPGDNATYQKYLPVTDQNYFNIISSDYNITDASFIRLKTLSIGYSIPKQILKRVELQSAKVYLQAQNLVTITNYIGLDPETGNAMPPLRIVSVGLQFNL